MPMIFSVIKDKASYLIVKPTYSFVSYRGCLRHDKLCKHEKWSLLFSVITIKLFPLSYVFLFFPSLSLSPTIAFTRAWEKITFLVLDLGRPFILLIPEVNDHEVWRLQWKSWGLMVSIIIIIPANGELSSRTTQLKRDKRKPSPQPLLTALISQICWSLFNRAPEGLLLWQSNIHQSCIDLTHSIMKWVSE